jgi:Mn2+/Fe2+ NRAMP family transporter
MATELLKKRQPGFVRGFGPGLVSGASANDPTTVGSIAVVAAATGYGLAWLVVLLLPMLAVVQSIAASVAAGSQMSLQQAILRTYGRLPALVAAFAVVGISVCTLGADVQAGAQALTLLTGVPFAYFIIPLVGVAAWILATKSYLKIERILASLTLIFLCYVASAILARPNWAAVLRAIVMPHFSLAPAFITGAIALLGTTLTGYVYFWESIEVAERRPEPAQFGAVKSDAVLGMLVAGSSFLFILIASAAAFGGRVAGIHTAADAAVALKPLVGSWDTRLFGLGLLASAAIAIPVIAATNGYVVAQTFGWNDGLAETPREARRFYAVIFVTLAAAGGIAFISVPTMALLFWASVAAGLATPVTLVLTMLVAQNQGVMRGRPIGPAVACAGWAVTVIVSLSSLAFVFSALVLRRL